MEGAVRKAKDNQERLELNGKLDIEGRVVFEMDLKEIWLECRQDSLGSGYILVGGSCERGNDSSSGLLPS
jgi:hypothetical protein